MLRWYFVAAVSILFGLACIFKLYRIQVKPTEELRKELPVKNLPVMQMVRSIPPLRGNIYSSDGKLLAISHNLYTVGYDPTVVHQTVFNSLVPELSKKLGDYFGEAPDYYEQLFREGREKGRKYILIARGLNHRQVQELRSFPIFRRGRSKGGYCEERYEERVFPMGEVARRTIGMELFDELENQNRSHGLEGSFGPVILEGVEGKRWMQRIQDGQWKPVNTEVLVDPEDGKDLVSSIDSNLQYFVHETLKKGMDEFDGELGSAVVMEVRTGRVRAIVNLGRTRDGEIKEIFNHAIGRKYAPGSTFKLMSMIAALEAKKADTSLVIDTSGGEYRVRNAVVRDSRPGGYGKISLGEAFVCSSNTAFARLIHEGYKDDEKEFLDQLASMRLTRRLNVGLRGEEEPEFHYPTDPEWSHLSLPWMAFGYEILMTPLQVLAFYNAVANDGELVKPSFITAIRTSRGDLQYFPREIVDRSICSRETARQARDLMRQVVQSPKGTAFVKGSDYIDFGGKTGTSKSVDKEDPWYTASFAGFFPVDKPEYSAIVLIHNPDKDRGFYGAEVALPVFREIAQYLAVREPEAEHFLFHDPTTEEIQTTRSLENAEQWRRLPDFQGLPGIEAIEWLESHGIEVEVDGSGKVLSQSVPAHNPLNNIKRIELKLS